MHALFTPEFVCVSLRLCSGPRSERLSEVSLCVYALFSVEFEVSREVCHYPVQSPK